MKIKEKSFIILLFVVITPLLFTSCLTFISELSKELDKQANTSSAEFGQLDNGSKTVITTTKLKEIDFNGSNFFITDIPNKYFQDMNIEIFSMLKESLKDGDFSPYDSKEYEDYVKRGGVKEGILFNPKDNLIVYNQELQKKNGKKGTMTYYFYFSISEECYKTYTETFAHLKKCDEQIELCNWNIENCAAPTIRKSKKVSVPYEVTERHWVPGTLGARTNSSFGSSEGTPGHYEIYTRTVYRDEVQYYDVANPNYDPEKVARAKKNLPLWQNDRDATMKKLKTLPPPFALLRIEGEDNEINQ